MNNIGISREVYSLVYSGVKAQKHARIRQWVNKSVFFSLVKLGKKYSVKLLICIPEVISYVEFQKLFVYFRIGNESSCQKVTFLFPLSLSEIR